MTVARRIGTVTLLALLAVGLLVAHAPLELGAIRIARVSALWWYATLVAPAAATLVAVIALLRRS